MLQNLYSSPYIIRMIKSRNVRWAGYVTRIEGDEKYKTSVRKTEGKKPFWSPGHGWDDNIKIDDVGGLA